jgi:hypothetical protein
MVDELDLDDDYIGTYVRAFKSFLLFIMLDILRKEISKLFLESFEGESFACFYEFLFILRVINYFFY